MSVCAAVAEERRLLGRRLRRVAEGAAAHRAEIEQRAGAASTSGSRRG